MKDLIRKKFTKYEWFSIEKCTEIRYYVECDWKRKANEETLLTVWEEHLCQVEFSKA